MNVWNRIESRKMATALMNKTDLEHGSTMRIGNEGWRSYFWRLLRDWSYTDDTIWYACAFSSFYECALCFFLLCSNCR